MTEKYLKRMGKNNGIKEIWMTDDILQLMEKKIKWKKRVEQAKTKTYQKNDLWSQTKLDKWTMQQN